MDTKTVMWYVFRRLAHLDVILCVASGLLFFCFPEVDFWVSQQFYVNGTFFLAENPVVRFFYVFFDKIHVLLLFVFLVGLTAIAIRKKTEESLVLRKQISFLLLVIVLAPGLLANTFLKDNSLGRPRPVHIEEFGGGATFVPIFVYSGECKSNCSFVSGHASIAFYFIAFAWAFKSRPLFFWGVFLGVFAGFGRIAQGGHFLSDVVFSFWLIYFVTLMISRVFKFTLEDDENMHSESTVTIDRAPVLFRSGESFRVL